jgi:predicted nuclease of restriction endonuclease-like (RecB) superfamily
MANLTSDPKGYRDLLALLTTRIRTAQLRASMAVNQELVVLYWGIGNEILTRQRENGWGTKVIERLAKDLRGEFPEMHGLSPRNLGYMKAFAEAWPDQAILQQLVAKLPWGHNVRLLDAVKNTGERIWYAEQAIANGWSRNVLVLQIESQLYRRQGKALTNFDRTLPPPQSDLAQQITKDPYNFDFLTLAAKAREKDLEAGLLEHIRKFLLELGIGFAFVGSQYPLEVGGEDFRIDLLFYHLRLRCFVVIDLKMGPFKPAYTGQMNFYLSAIDELLRHETDQPTIGLILCKSKNQIVAEYALRDMTKPLGISEFHHLEQLPDQLEGSLPTIEALEAELAAPEESPIVKGHNEALDQMARDAFDAGLYDNAEIPEGGNDE